MGSDTSIRRLSLERRAEIIFKKIIFDCDTKEGLKYSISGASFDNNVTCLSENAYQLIKQKYPKGLHADYYFSNRTYNDLRQEHVIPTEVIWKDLASKAKEGTLSLKYVLDVLKVSHVALITPEEDKLLNTAKLKNSMPLGFKLLEDDPFSRYEAAGIQMHKWAA